MHFKNNYYADNISDFIILVVRMEDENMHYRYMLLFYFCKGKNANEPHKKLFSVYGGKALSRR